MAKNKEDKPLGLTGLKELDAIIRATSKHFGRDCSHHNYGDLTAIPTGIMALDNALRIGGIPRGRVTEIFGNENSGKTSLALCIMANAQKIRKEQGREARDLLLDKEATLTASFIEGFGVDLKQVIWLRPFDAEEALQIAIDYPKSGQIDTVLLDSVDALQTEKQLARRVSDNNKDMGGIGKDMSFTMRQLCHICSETNTTFMFINQVRANLDPYGSPWVTPGGNALPFYASVRLQLKKGKPSLHVPDAYRMRVKIYKTKVGMPWGTDDVEFEFRYGKGPHPGWDLLILGKQLGVLKSAGPTIQGCLNGTNEYETLFKGTQADFVDVLLEDKELYEKIKTRCLDFQEVH